MSYEEYEVPDNRVLAPNFSLYEMVATNHRSLWEENLKEAFYGNEGENLRKLTLVAEMLQLIRDHFSAPVSVHSGFRGEALNNAVGGSSSSQHRKAEAADFHVIGVGLTSVFTWIVNESGIPFGQAILEGASPGKPTWIHLSLGPPYRSVAKSGQAMTYDRTNGYRTWRG